MGAGRRPVTYDNGMHYDEPIELHAQSKSVEVGAPVLMALPKAKPAPPAQALAPPIQAPLELPPPPKRAQVRRVSRALFSIQD